MDKNRTIRSRIGPTIMGGNGAVPEPRPTSAVSPIGNTRSLIDYDDILDPNGRTITRFRDALVAEYLAAHGRAQIGARVGARVGA